MKLPVWISYNLGIKGDFNGLYQWLDTHKGIECGNGTAFIKFEYQKNFLEELKSDLEKSVEINPTDRVYIIYKDSEKNKTVGKFLFGNRKAAPWTGYAPSSEPTEEIL